MTIRTLKEEELSLLFHYSELENWILEEIETEALFYAHPQDFFIALEDEKVIGFVIAIKDSEKLGFISSLLVLKEFRAKGYGRTILQHALKHLEPLQIALDCVLGEEKFYEKFGFQPYFDVCIYKFVLGSMEIGSLSLEDFRIEENISHQHKKEYQKLLFEHEDVVVKTIVSNHEECAYGYIFSYLDGYKIEMHATNINELLALFCALTQKLEDGTNIYIKADMLSPILLSLTKILNMQVHHKYTRMYNKII